MRAQVTAEQAAFYRENGFVIIEDFLSPDEVKHWVATLDDAIRRRGPDILPDKRGFGMEPGEGSRPPMTDEELYYSKVFTQRINLWRDSDEVKRLILDPGIGRMATELTGNDGFRVWHDQALYKAPWANPTALHTDNPYWAFHSPDSISIWIALDDATKQNGCLYFLPGTHKICGYDPVPIGAQMDAIFERYPSCRDIEPVAAEMKAGWCSFHNGLTIHGAGANMTPRWRRAMTCAFMPVGATFNGNRNILTREQFERLKVGDLLEDDEQNPVVWARSEAQVASD